jgi:hypothetical protein
MDIATIAKKCTHIQKQSLHNLIDTLFLFHENVERTSRYWACQIGLNGNAEVVSDQYRKLLKQGRENSVKLVDQSYNSLEDYFSAARKK